MNDLRDLYQEMILDHSKRPRNFGKLEGANHEASGYNPLCGDRFTVHIKVDDDIIREIRFEGSGCAISTASASLMTEGSKGKTLAEAETLFEKFHKLITGDAAEPQNAEALGKLLVFSGVKEFPVRVKCATLPWHTLKAALHDGHKVVSTE
ncbi:MAG: SUF system NifU family Fe-S cluster assembly protein [Acidobacteria bacterium RIFCSPLOWO2_12_FULL_54_10]|nr:MAG: SUF system NifU family Fe-S cluster assembly protein [Acidobacteria bacterium RIFCSPLOWO2_12_FULL_54_10]